MQGNQLKLAVLNSSTFAPRYACSARNTWCCYCRCPALLLVVVVICCCCHCCLCRCCCCHCCCSLPSSSPCSVVVYVISSLFFLSLSLARYYTYFFLCPQAGFLDALASAEFVSLSRSVEKFVSGCEAVCGRQSHGLRTVLVAQAKKFVERFHEEKKQKLRYFNLVYVNFGIKRGEPKIQYCTRVWIKRLISCFNKDFDLV